MLGARNPSVRLVRHKSELFGNKRPKSEVICPGVGNTKIPGTRERGSGGDPSPQRTQKRSPYLSSIRDAVLLSYRLSRFSV